MVLFGEYKSINKRDLDLFAFYERANVYNLMTVLRGSVYVQLFNWHNNNASFDSFIDFRNIKELLLMRFFSC